MRNSVQVQKPSFNSEHIDDMQLPVNEKTNEIPSFDNKKAINTNQMKEEITN